jgi:DNA-binding MarR family transcriptional regulator
MTRPSRDPAPDRTPQARLTEGLLHGLLGYQLAQAAIVTDQVFTDAVGGPLALRPVEYTILALIEANPGLTARQLARALAVTPPNIALWLERLDGRRLIQRSRSERDARVQHIDLTTEGRTLARRSTQRLLDAEASALSSMTAAERAMLVELVHKVAMTRGRAHGR